VTRPGLREGLPLGRRPLGPPPWQGRPTPASAAHDQAGQRVPATTTMWHRRAP